MIQPLFLLMRWVQTLPIAMLMLVPFEDHDLRLRRRTGNLLAFAYLLAMGLVMALVSAVASVDGHRNIAVRDLSLAVVLALYLSAWAMAVRVPAVRKMLVAVILLHYAAMLNALGNLLAAMVLQERYLEEISRDAGSLAFDLCLLAATALTYPLVWYFLRHILRKSFPVLGDRQTWRGLGYLCIVFLLFGIVTYAPSYDNQPEAFLTLGALIATDVLAYYIFFQEIGAVRRQAEIAQQLADYRIQYQTFVSRMEGVRRLRHDLRHHLNLLSSLNAQGRAEDIAVYLKEYGKVYEQLEQQKFCGDPAVDSVLGYYMAQAREENIPFECQAPLDGCSGVQDMDMTVLLGNCLENAMEAVQKLPPEKRRISLEMQPVGAMLLLRVVNACPPGIDSGGFAGWQAFPSSKARDRMGMGLRSITDIAEKYGGSAQFQRKGEEFTSRVALCVQPQAKEAPYGPSR